MLTFLPFLSHLSTNDKELNKVTIVKPDLDNFWERSLIKTSYYLLYLHLSTKQIYMCLACYQKHSEVLMKFYLTHEDKCYYADLPSCYASLTWLFCYLGVLRTRTFEQSHGIRTLNKVECQQDLFRRFSQQPMKPITRSKKSVWQTWEETYCDYCYP